MSVATTDFTKAGGLLNTKALWPGLSPTKVTEKFTAWLDDAAAQPGIVAQTAGDQQDLATRQWTLYRAWDDVYQVRLGNPSSVSVDQEGSSGYTQGQIDAAREERDQALLRYEAAIEVTATVELVPVNRFSRTTRAAFEF